MPAIFKQRGMSRRQFLNSLGVASGAALVGAYAGPNPLYRSLSDTQKESTMIDVNVQPFTVNIPDEALDTLRQRIAATNWPRKELVTDSSQGVQLATMQALAKYWGSYDWRKFEAKLNALPQFMTTLDGVDIHFIHVKSKHENALPLLITHGWPGSIIEMLDVIDPLTNPTAHGGSAADAFDVVIPSLPGYGFSSAPTDVGWSPAHVGQAWGGLMQQLGYSRYVAQGGDQGASVTDIMARLAPPGLIGVHFNFLVTGPNDVLAALFFGAPVPKLSDEEKVAFGGIAATFKRGYIVEMGEHPQSIGYGITDSPVGLASWMLDHDADSYGKISNAFLTGQVTGNLTPEHIVDNLSLYWLTNTATSAARLYWESNRFTAAALASGQPTPPVQVPVAFTEFPGELYPAPRTWLEQVYPNLIYVNKADRGGHFAAWEEPELFASEMRAAFKSLR